MPLQKKDRHTEQFQKLSTVKSSPRSVICGRHEQSQRYTENNATPSSQDYAIAPDWKSTTNQKGPRIGAKSIVMSSSVSKGVLDPDTMLGSTLRSKATYGIGQYDPPPGMGQYSPRKSAAVMCGNHGKTPLAGSSADTSSTPGPNNYHSEYGSMGYKATQLKQISARSTSTCSTSRTSNSQNNRNNVNRGSCTFGRKTIDRQFAATEEGVPGPGSYDEDYRNCVAQLQPDPRNPRKMKRPVSMQNSFSSKGSSMAGRCGAGSWAFASTTGANGEVNHQAEDTGPGPSEYTPQLPFIGSANAQTPSVKGRLPHPFVDTLAMHECAKTEYNHEVRSGADGGEKILRFKARVRAQ